MESPLTRPKDVALKIEVDSYSLGEDCTAESRLLLGYVLFRLLEDQTNKIAISMSNLDPSIKCWELIFGQSLQHKHVQKMAKASLLCRWDVSSETTWPVFTEFDVDKKLDRVSYTLTIDDRVLIFLSQYPIELTLDHLMRWPSGLAYHYFKTLTTSNSAPESFEQFDEFFDLENHSFGSETKPRMCPLCRQSKIKNIMYGMPSSDVWDLEEKGEIILGGCCVDQSSPEWGCPNCGLRIGREYDFDPLAVY